MKNIKKPLSAIYMSATIFVTMIGAPLLQVSNVMADSTDMPHPPIEIGIEFDENCEKTPEICFITPNVSWNG